jgi:ribosomal-protein-alanine N-acetyltransferase
MTLEDFPQVTAIENRAYPFPWTLGNFKDALASGYSMWVMQHEQQLSGYYVLMMALDEAHLLNLTIAPDWQDQGWGNWLLARSIEMARQHGAVRLLLEVRPSNLPAQGLCQKHGFVQIGRRPGYYPHFNGQREDALVMALEC